MEQLFCKMLDDAFLAGCKVGYGDKLEGIEMARREGYDAGNEAGYEIGYDHGYSQGNDEGYADGVADGYDEGYVDGYEDGYEDGEKDEAGPAWIAGWGRVS